MAEAYKVFSGSSKQDVVFAADGRSTEIKRKLCVKRKGKERSALSIYM
jgi:hypothetical protein